MLSIRTGGIISPNAPAGFRNDPVKGEVAIRKKDTQSYDAFVAKFRRGLRGKVLGWEEDTALPELERKGMVAFLCGEGELVQHSQLRHLFGAIFHQVRVYRKDTERFEVRDDFNEADQLLKAEEKRNQREENRARLEDLRLFFKDRRVSILHATGVVAYLRVKRDTSTYGFWEELIWPDVPIRKVVARKIELDTRFQIEVGKVLAFYLRERRVSLRTIARLILLAYWAGNLSECTEKFTQSKYTGRAIRVKNIYDNLRDAGLHKAVSYKAKRSYKQLKAEVDEARKIVGPAGSGLRILYLLYFAKVVKHLGLTHQQSTHLIQSLRNPRRG